MYCSNCGKKLKSSQNFCDGCGHKVLDSNKTNKVTELESEAVDSDIERGFSWGFLFLPFLYSANMGFSYMFVIGAFILQVLSAFPETIIIYLIVAIPLGFKVRSDAYNGNRKWKSDGEFKDVQRIWGIVGFIVFCIQFYLGYTGAFDSSIYDY